LTAVVGKRYGCQELGEQRGVSARGRRHQHRIRPPEFSAIIVLVVMGSASSASMMGIFNFAHGEFLLLGAYTVYLTNALGYPVWLGMLIAPFSVALVGFLLERGVIRFFYADPVVVMLGTYAIGLVIRESVRGLVGGIPLGARARNRIVQPRGHRGVQGRRRHVACPCEESHGAHALHRSGMRSISVSRHQRSRRSACHSTSSAAADAVNKSRSTSTNGAGKAGSQPAPRETAVGQ
jgi:hypothetical protein